MMDHMNNVYEVNGKVYVIDILNAYNYDWYIENAYGKWITAINPLEVYAAYWEVSFFPDLYNKDKWIETLEKAKKAAVLPFIDKYAESWKKTSEITRNTEPEEVAKLFMKECGYRKQA